MPSGGSQLAFRALRFQCAADQKWSWSVSRQNTHRNHFTEAWIMHEALRSCSGLAVLTCRRWPVHRSSGGLVVPSCCVARGCVSWAAGRRGDWKQTCIFGSGCSEHREYSCTELSRAPNVEFKGAVFFPYRCRPLCTAELSNFRQERFWAAVAPFQELIRTWNRAQALNALYLGSEWLLSLLL